MSRYSPTVHPDYGPGLAEAVAKGFETYVNARRQKKQDKLTERDRDETSRSRAIQAAADGWRSGQAPTTETTRELRDDALGAPVERKPFGAPPPSGNMLAEEFAKPEGELPMSINQGEFRQFASPFAASAQQQEAPPELAPKRHPGAFDPKTRSFASMTQTVERPVAPGRYVPDVAGGYIDMAETPRSDSREAREAQLRLAAEFKGNEIDQRGRQASTLEDQRQQGRQALRTSINGNTLANTALRALLAGENDRASDARDAARGQAHDVRVTNRINGGGAGGDKPAAEANRLRAAAAIIEASNGSYDAAVDWLENTPEGQAAAQRGLRKDHLYAGLGTFIKGQQTLATGLQGGNDGMEPAAATGATGATRTAVTPPRRTQPGEPTGMAGIRSRPPAAGGAAPPAAGQAPPADPEEASKETWIAQNPRQAGETVAAWRARYLASKKK